MMARLYWLGVALILIAVVYQYRKEIRTLVLKTSEEPSPGPPKEKSGQEESSDARQKKSEEPAKDEASDPEQDSSAEGEASATADKNYYNPPFDPDNPPKPRYSKAGTRLITLNELAAHGHSGPLKPIWLAIMGRVYNVDKGAEHYYGPEGGYKFFTGRDAGLFVFWE